jgi:DNA-binding NarL/FixJ family response regulator
MAEMTQLPDRAHFKSWGPIRVRVLAGTLARATAIATVLDDERLDLDVAVGRVGDARGHSDLASPAVLVMADVTRASDLRELVRVYPESRIVVLSTEPTATATRRLLEEGADGVVDDPDGMPALPAVVTAVAVGQICVPQRTREVVEPPALSTRERQVLALMASGLSNAEIAEQLFLSESTIKSHAASAFRRLGVRSRREAVAIVLGTSETLRRSVLMSHPLEAPQRGNRRRENGKGDKPT